MSTKVSPGDMISAFTKEEAMEFPMEIKGLVTYGQYQEPEGSFDAALVLGGRTKIQESRALAAAKLYHKGLCSLFIPTGGVLWDTPYGHIPESQAIARHMMDAGVPESCIVLEDRATTTHENMTYGRELITERLGDIRPRIAIVTSYFHVRRSVAIAQTHMSDADIFGVKADFPLDDPENFFRDPELIGRAATECRLLCDNVHKGLIPDFRVL